MWRERGKNAKFWALPPFGAPPFGAHPWGPHPFRPPPLQKKGKKEDMKRNKGKTKQRKEAVPRKDTRRLQTAPPPDNSVLREDLRVNARSTNARRICKSDPFTIVCELLLFCRGNERMQSKSSQTNQLKKLPSSQRDASMSRVPNHCVSPQAEAGQRHFQLASPRQSQYL